MADEDRGPEPVLKDLFDEFGTSLADQVAICKKKKIPKDILRYAADQADGWEVEDLEQSLQMQCGQILPPLQSQLDAEKRMSDKEKKEAEEEQKKLAAARRAELKAIDDKKKAEQKAKKAADDARKKEAAAAKKAIDDKKKAEEKAKKDEENRRKKALDDEKKAAEKARKDEENARKKAEQDAKKGADQRQKEEERARKEEEQRQKKAIDDEKKAAEKARRDEENARKKAEQDAKKGADQRKKEEERARKEEEQRQKKAIDDEKKAAEKARRDEENARKKAEQDAKKSADQRKKEEEKAKKEEEQRQKKAIDDEKKAAEKARRDEENARKKEEQDAKKSEEQKRKDEENARKKEEQDAKKSEAQRKREEEKAKRDAENEKKKAEAAAKKAVDDQRKAEEKAKREEQRAIDDKKRAEERAVRDEENRVKKEEQDKKKAEAKAKKDAADAVKREKKEEEDRKKAEEKAKKDELQRKIKAEKEAKAAEEEAKKSVEQKRQEAEARAKKEENDRKKEEEKKKREERRKENKAKREEEKKKEAEEKKKEKQEEARRKSRRAARRENSDEEWDEETGQMVRSERMINHRDYTKDSCCNSKGTNVCRGFSFVLMLIIFPAIFVICVFTEYEKYGWERFSSRANGEGYNITDFNQPSPAPVPERPNHAPTPQPMGKRVMIASYIVNHPLSWALPAIGFVSGLFGNIVPVGPALALMPLFQELEVSKTPDGAFLLACWVHFLGNGVFGFISWSCRDVRFFVCRALFMVSIFGSGGYLVGVTDHLTLKDLLRNVDESTDDKVSENYEVASLDKLHTYVRIALGGFLCFMSLWVLVGVCIGGVNRFCCPSRTGGSTPGCKSCCQWIIVLICSFHTGWLFVANIGAGMGIFTFFLLSLFLGVETKRAFPTSIIIAGWVSIAPICVHNAVTGEFPYVRLLMMTPGLWFGSLLAPWFSKCGGPMCDLTLFWAVCLAVGTAVLFNAYVHLQKNEEDMDINIKPMYGIPAVDAMFGDFAPSPQPVKGKPKMW